jgi:acetyltransferase-like isoleucine patch superfamily enzyme
VGLTAKLAYRAYLALMGNETMTAVKLRRHLFDRILGRRHKNLWIHSYAFIEDPQGLVMGDGVSINRDCNLSCGGRLTIGNDVAIGHSTTILTADHGFDDPSTPIKYQPLKLRPVKIGDNVWIGARAIILSGVTLPRGTIVAAGAIVTRSVEEENCTIAGVPARIVKRRG